LREQFLKVEKAPLPNFEVPECRMPEDVSYLFEKSLFWDCKIISEQDEKEFKVLTLKKFD